ncbi:hypothetical protein [Blastococcus sp. TF02A-26]|uniref:hypothetical protein n=1 Tax=Blastococcus sp. TF02A-26 TaxID=2250577 RepID=UPI0011BFB6BB|nr:hypothetical protein [Blastococcus sp. TF02A-26]
MWTPPNECPRCGGEVLWGYTENGKRMAIDPARYPDDDTQANQAVYVDHLRRLRIRQLSKARPLASFEHRAMPHVATCPAEIRDRQARAAAASRPARRGTRGRGRGGGHQTRGAASLVIDLSSRRILR